MGLLVAAPSEQAVGPRDRGDERRHHHERPERREHDIVRAIAGDIDAGDVKNALIVVMSQFMYDGTTVASTSRFAPASPNRSIGSVYASAINHRQPSTALRCAATIS